MTRMPVQISLGYFRSLKCPLQNDDSYALRIGLLVLDTEFIIRDTF